MSGGGRRSSNRRIGSWVGFAHLRREKSTTRCVIDSPPALLDRVAGHPAFWLDVRNLTHLRATRLERSPDRDVEEAGRRLVAWSDLEVRQAGCGIVIRVQTPRFADWWHDAVTWEGDPMGLVHAWVTEERDF